MHVHGELLRLYRESPEHRALWEALADGRSIPDPFKTHPLPCIHEGAVLEWCSTCDKIKGNLRHVRDCDIHERCTRGQVSSSVRSCSMCPDYADPPAMAPRKITRIDPDKLGKGLTHRRTNCSMIRFQGRLLLAYRTDMGGSQVWVSELGEDLSPVGKPTRLALDHDLARFGREDPRLFVHRDRLHVAYAGVEGMKGPTSLLYAILRDNLTVERIWYPHWWQRPAWEKNWAMFSHDGDLFAVYSIDPHVIFRVEENHAYPVYGTPNPLPWAMPGDGLVNRRGGAPPVRVGDEYYHWFHGHRHDPLSGWHYCASVYTFAARQPFEPLRAIGYPLWLPDTSKKHMNEATTQDVLFPCGAILEKDRWLVSAGHQDAECLVGEFDAKEIDLLLKPV